MESNLWDIVRKMRDVEENEQNRIALELVDWLLEKDVKLGAAADALFTAYEFVHNLQFSIGTLREAVIRSDVDMPFKLRPALEKSPDFVAAKPSDGE